MKPLSNRIEQTYEGLPEECYSVNLIDKKLILIKRGVCGYYAQNPENLEWSADNVDELNKANGVTKGQRRAMEFGSMFGWLVDGANPTNYDDEGNYTVK